MAWVPLETGLSGSADEVPKIWMDRRGFPYCAWILSSGIRFAFFGGIEWEYLGDSPIAVPSGAMDFPENPICADSVGNPSILYYDLQGVLKHTWWDGEEWLEHGDGDVTSSVAETATVLIRLDVEYVVYIKNGASSREIVILRRNGSIWEELTSKSISYQDSNAGHLKAAFQEEKLYAFWTASESGLNRIGSAIYDLGTGAWETKLAGDRVPETVTTSSITGIDFEPQ